MYVRLVTYHMNDRVTRDDASTTYNQIVSVLREENGYQGSTLMIDEVARTAVSLTYWKDEGCAARAGERVLPMLFERATELTDRAPEISGYHVVEHNLDDA